MERREALHQLPGLQQPGSSAQLVVDTRYGWWTVYTLPAAAMMLDGNELLFADHQGIDGDWHLWAAARERRLRRRGAQPAALPRALALRLVRLRHHGDQDALRDPPLRCRAAAPQAVARLPQPVRRRPPFAARSAHLVLGRRLRRHRAGRRLTRHRVGARAPRSTRKPLRRAVRGAHFSFALEGDVGSGMRGLWLERWAVHRATHFVRQSSGVAASRREL